MRVRKLLGRLDHQVLSDQYSVDNTTSVAVLAERRRRRVSISDVI